MSHLSGPTSTVSSADTTSDSLDCEQLSSQGDRRVMGLVLSMAACLIISTNLLVAAALLRLLLRRSSQSWALVLNLALADTLLGVGVTGLAAEDFNSNFVRNQHIVSTNGTSSAPQGKTRCLVRMAFVTSPCMASILSMFLISLDRYAAIKMPLRYALLSRKETAAGFLLVLWVSSITMGFLPVMVQELQSRRPYDGYCALFSVTHDITIIVLYCLLFFPVLALFVYIYLDILRIACSHQRQISQIRQASSRTDDQDPGPHQYQHQQLRGGYWSHVKALRTVAVLIGCFLTLWCPFFVVCIVHLVCDQCGLKDVLENYLWLLGLSNSLINPLVYAFWQREVRLQLADMFSCISSRFLAAGPSGVTEPCQQVAPAQTHTCVSEGDTPNPSLMQPVSSSEAHRAPLSDTTSL
ncbi:glucose-dependent insulinotropic receptor [Austrofundulus limnaeus]|uniref:Glucose-dependent insulinotropic receptor n=1 Tax=Austrofundulus limnaeus TaxID=52670 RepID=A0A2I4CNX1_AUSLI|nr:PREDICTED: glucose-dependent insulinotropic receptor [Austrofundulus limnaeus]